MHRRGDRPASVPFLSGGGRGATGSCSPGLVPSPRRRRRVRSPGMAPAPALRRYRANVNVAGLSAGEVVEIDPSVPTWRELIDAGWLTEDTSDAVPDPAAYMIDEDARKGEGDDGTDRGADAGRTTEGQTSDTAIPGDGADGHDVGRAEPEPSPADLHDDDSASNTSGRSESRTSRRGRSRSGS